MATERIDVYEYFRRAATLTPSELVHGIVREPPAPRYGHQSVVTHLAALLDTFVRASALGRVCVSPVDVVLDEPGALVLQPDIVFVAADRLHVIRDRIWGAPDLVVEVLSPGTARRDRTAKLAWYRKYGVRECWLMDTQSREVVVVAFGGARPRRRTFRDAKPIRSHVLAGWDASPDAVFD